MSSSGLAPRRAAYFMLNDIMGQERLLSELIQSDVMTSLQPEDRARAQRLTVGVLRGLDRLDRMMKPLVPKRPPLRVQNALRLAMYELVHHEAGHGVVNAYVSLLSEHKKTKGFKGLANAVLRKACDDVQSEQGLTWGKMPIPQLPKWLRRPLMDAWGQAALAGIERAHFAGAPLDLTAKSDPEQLARALDGQLLPTGSVRLEQGQHVTALAGFEEGAWWVQDAAAALPVKVLAPSAGQRVLDLCAAPGGKTMQLAALGADVTAVDLNPKRMERVEENLARVGLTAQTHVGDALAFEDELGFDAVLLDAPCSATGTIRRHPDLPFAKDGSDFLGLFELQEQLIDHAVSLLKPGGILLYCTCSLLPDEGEVQVEEALSRHSSLSVSHELYQHDWIDPSWRTEEGGLRLRPDYWHDLGGLDGFYIAALQKT